MNELDLKSAIDGVGNKLEALVADWRKADADQKSVLETRIKTLEEAQKALQERAQQAERLHLPGVEVTKTGEKNKFSYTRLAQIMGGVRKENDPEVGYEVEVCNTMHKRFDGLPVEMKTAINAASGAGGAFLIPTEVYNDIIPELEANSILAQLGLRSFSGLTGNVAWNRDLGGITAAYLDSEAEETGSESTSTFGRMELKPHVYAAFVPLTFGMLNQPAMAIEPWVRSRMAYKIGLLKDLNGFNGTGANSKPIGLLNAGTQTLSWSGVNTAVELMPKIAACVAKLADANAIMPGAKLGWAMGTFATTYLSGSFDTTGRSLLWNMNATTLESVRVRLAMLAGFPLKETTQLNTGATTGTEVFYYGDWNQGAEFNWGTLAFASSDSTETNFRKLRVTVRAVGAHDFGWFQPNAFVRNTALDTTTGWAVS